MENSKLAALFVTSIFTGLVANVSNLQTEHDNISANETMYSKVEMRTCGQCNGPVNTIKPTC